MKKHYWHLIFPIILFAQTPAMAFDGNVFEAERKAIKAQTGCYEVEFRFQETFPYQDGYQLAQPYYAKAKEWVELIEDEPGKMSLQHILQTTTGPIKHWRQVWEYEAKSVFEYQGQGLWLKRDIAPSQAAAAWAQKVYQVDDSPRYECLASWTQLNQDPIWECETFSPVPRRENSRIDKYDILQRRNRHVIRSNAWIHEQDNLKLQLVEDELQPLVGEKGLNTYRRLPIEECTAAINWWAENRESWLQVQSAWDRVYEETDRIAITDTQADELARNLYQVVADYKTNNDFNLEEAAYQLIIQGR